MRKYGGKLIHSSWDSEGLVEVIDSWGTRSLHFGTPPKQSAISLADPDRLELSYIRTMLAGLLLAPDIEKILLLGLGGGSLAKFFLANFPECRIDAVESRTAVVAVARRFFGLPEDPRLTIHITDAGEFVLGAAAQASTYGHIFVDIYDRDGLAGVADEPDFIAGAGSLLADHGILAMNLWGSHAESLRQSLGLLKAHFGEDILRLHVPGRGNVIAFGAGRQLAVPRRSALTPRARLLEQRLGIEFTRFLQRLSPLKG